MIEHEQWMETAFTRKLLLDLQKAAEKALAQLRSAAQQSTDPLVRHLSATYETNLRTIKDITAKRAEGRENGD